MRMMGRMVPGFGQVVLPLIQDYVFGRSTKERVLRGTVTDASGAVIQNASVTLTDQETNVARKTNTDERRAYSIQAQPATRHSMQVRFQKHESQYLSIGCFQLHQHPATHLSDVQLWRLDIRNRKFDKLQIHAAMIHDWTL